jgi:hypothetical protein
VQILILGIKALPPEASIQFSVSFEEKTTEIHFHFHHRFPLGHKAPEDSQQKATPHLMADQMKMLLIDHLLELLHGRRNTVMQPEADALLDVYVPLLPENHVEYKKPSADNTASVG